MVVVEFSGECSMVVSGVSSGLLSSNVWMFCGGVINIRLVRLGCFSWVVNCVVMLLFRLWLVRCRYVGLSLKWVWV